MWLLQILIRGSLRTQKRLFLLPVRHPWSRSWPALAAFSWQLEGTWECWGGGREMELGSPLPAAVAGGRWRHAALMGFIHHGSERLLGRTSGMSHGAHTHPCVVAAPSVPPLPKPG